MNVPMISYTYSSYLSIAIVAALDTVFGGIASVVKGNFDLKIFLSGFFVNSILSMALTFLGNKLNVARKTASNLKKASSSLNNNTKTASVVNNYNFYQTNNSPKALSRIDVYRDTQKLLDLAGGSK